MTDTWDEWNEHHAKSPFPAIRDYSMEINRDGIVSDDHSLYFNSDPRIVFALKECNVPPKRYDHDLCAYLRDNPLHGAFALNLARWSCAIRHCDKSVSELNASRTTLLEGLMACAVVNLKKVAGGSTADMSEINTYSHHDRQLLVRQIRALKPNIIVSCGTTEQLLWLLELEPLRSVECESLGGERWVYKSEILKDCLVISFRHPSRVPKPEGVMKDLRKVYLALLEENR